MCDPYIPLENDLRYTRKCLEIIDRYGFGLTILTKSNGILRDLDLLADINARTKCVAQITLTTYDEDLCKIIEPAVCTTGERFAALETLRDAGIPTVVWLGPFLPFINDTEENLRGILDYCVRAKVYGIVFWGIGMTLRDGNREYFYKKLDEHFPGLSGRYHQKYDRSYGIESDNNRRLTPLFRETCAKHGIVHDRDEVFRYMGAFPDKSARQLSLF